MKHLRNRILNLLFSLLYGRLVFFHETAGTAVFGDAWHYRRLWCLSGLAPESRVADVGAGEGRLVEEARRRALEVQGFDPSSRMRAAARRRGVPVSSGSSFDLPLESGSLDRIVVTYPGAWIAEEPTWDEFARILNRSGSVRVLIGGTYEKGSGSKIRSLLIRLAYGRASGSRLELPSAVSQGFIVQRVSGNDCWGTAHYLVATRPG